MNCFIDAQNNSVIQNNSLVSFQPDICTVSDRMLADKQCAQVCQQCAHSNYYNDHNQKYAQNVDNRACSVSMLENECITISPWTDKNWNIEKCNTVHHLCSSAVLSSKPNWSANYDGCTYQHDGSNVLNGTCWPPNVDQNYKQSQNKHYNSESITFDNLLTQINQAYCLWDINCTLDLTQQPVMTATLPHGFIKSQTTNVDFDISNTVHTSHEKVSKGDHNLELLKDFDYTVKTCKNSKHGNDITVYTCRHMDCNKKFTRTWNLLDHARVHLGVKPFACSQWRKVFTQKGNLMKHLKVHALPDVDSRKRYFCNLCSSSYTERYNYKVIDYRSFVCCLSNLCF